MSNKDFDAIARAMDSGNHEELDRLMAAELTEEPVTEEIEEVVEEVIEEEEVLDETKDEKLDAEDKGDNSPKVVAEDEEDETPDEAATAAATPANQEADREKEIQRLRSDAGRVPFLQRKMAELERELRATKARTSQTTLDKNGKPTVDVKDVVLDEETQREIDELKEIDPVMARLVERVAKSSLAAARGSADHVVTTFTQAEQEREDYEFLESQKAELVREVPQADEIFALPQWKEWKDTLTPGQRALAESSYASEVKQAIYAFAAVMQQNQAPVAPAAPAAASKLEEERARKVGSSAEVKASAAKKTVEFDENAYFEQMYNDVGKKNHILK